MFVTRDIALPPLHVVKVPQQKKKEKGKKENSPDRDIVNINTLFSHSIHVETVCPHLPIVTP